MSIAADISSELLSAWVRGSRRIRQVLLAAVGFASLAVVVVALGEAELVTKQFTAPIGGALGAIAGLLGMGAIAQQRVLLETADRERIATVEKHAYAHPEEPKAAWDLARVKLESYLNRNLNQVRSIFWLTALVMIAGLCLIGYGVLKAFNSPQAIEPAVLTTCAGIVVNIIGATFLVVYRSTMSQAKEYVTVLERINAVGMAVQILDSIDDDPTNLKRQSRADLAKQLLSLYTPTK